ncbi:integrase core domain-containing protein [Cupriavidus sp. H19C3]|uniref:integrase core domain-containing protein n=1 Tax=Cupriavidus sp. H19C3 TaxID=3241603 RepID=UPI003BF87EA3
MLGDRGGHLIAGHESNAGSRAVEGGARGLPASITVDNGPEFAGKVLDAWAYEAGVTLSFIRPGKPVENAYIESFNDRFRDECLNEHGRVRNFVC